MTAYVCDDGTRSTASTMAHDDGTTQANHKGICLDLSLTTGPNNCAMAQQRRHAPASRDDGTVHAGVRPAQRRHDDVAPHDGRGYDDGTRCHI